MNITKTGKKTSAFVRVLFFTYMLFIVLEKLSWDIGGWGANIFMISTPIILIVLCMVYTIKGKSIRFTTVDNRFFAYYIFWILYVCLQFLVIDHTPVMTTQYIKGIVTIGVEILSFVNFWLMINYDDCSIDFDYVSKSFYILTVVNLLYCIMQNINPNVDTAFIQLFHSQVVRYGTDGYGAINRPTGLFIESNFNGPFLVLGFINATYRLRSAKKSKKARLVAYAVIIITLFEIFMTLSLTTYIGLAFYGVYMFLKLNTNKKMVLLATMAGLSIVAVYFYLSDSGLRNAINSKFSTFDSVAALKNNSHYIIAIQALEIFTLNLRNIFFGTGYNCLNVFFQNEFLYESMKAHNYYLQRLIELGLLGFPITLYYIRLLFNPTRKTGAEAFLLKVMLLSMLSMNFTYDAFTRNYNIIFVIFAILLYKNRHRGAYRNFEQAQDYTNLGLLNRN